MKPHNVIKELNLLEISAVDRPAQVGARMTLLKRADPEADKASSTAEKNGNPETSQGNDMTDVTIEGLQKALDETKTALADAQKLAKASDAVKAHMSKMSDEEKGKFMALSPEEQEKRVAALKKADDSVELNGTVITKSAVGNEVFAVLKAQNEQMRKAEERIEKAETEAKLERLAKRADDELAALPGDRLAKARILKASDALTAEDKTVFDQMLKAANSSLAKAFTSVGKNGTKEVAEGSAEDQLQKKAEEIAKRDSVSVAKAYETAITENPDLYESIETPKA